MKTIGILIQHKNTTIWEVLYSLKPFGKFRYYGSNKLIDFWKDRKNYKLKFLYNVETN